VAAQRVSDDLVTNFNRRYGRSRHRELDSFTGALHSARHRDVDW